MNLNVKIAVGCLVFLFAISFTETLLGAEVTAKRVEKKVLVERPSAQVVVDRERMEYIVTFACIKHTAVVRAKAQDTARKAGKTEYKMPKDTFKRCVKWVEYELKMKQLFEA